LVLALSHSPDVVPGEIDVRQQRCGEDGSSHAGDRGYDSFEKFGREAERETAVAGAVLMAAFERVVIIA
jgi:hypothetical protein